MSEEKIYNRINEIDQKFENKTDALRESIYETERKTSAMVETFYKHINDMTTSSAVLAERFNQMKNQVESIPTPKERPCEQFTEHIKDHKEANKLWKRPIIAGIIGGAFASLMIVLKGFFEWLTTKL